MTFKASSGIGSVSGKADIYPNTQTELLSGSKAYDCWETIGERLPAMTMTNTIEPIPTSKLSNWNSIRDTFTKADPRMEDRAQISGQIWADLVNHLFGWFQLCTTLTLWISTRS